MTSTSDRRAFHFGLGLAAGLAIAFVWPHEHAAAVSTDSNDKFALCTVSIDIVNTVEAVFVLDFLTGQLRGAALSNATGLFTLSYFRNIAQDFQVNPNTPGSYAIVTGRAALPSNNNYRPAAGVLYIAEAKTGKVVCYSFPFQAANRPVAGPLPVAPVDGFAFREAVQ